MREPNLQPDQQPRRWDDHVALYEAGFEPLTQQFAPAALEMLSLSSGDRLLDVGAGSGGAALMAERTGADVVAVDASHAMAARIRTRAGQARIRALVMDAEQLGFAGDSFGAAISIFGIVLCPDPVRALREMARVVRPAGRVAIVTWTEPERYELVVRLLAAVAAIRGPQPMPAGVPPAQLRFVAEHDFRALFRDAGLNPEQVRRVEATLDAPSARWLATRLAFAPGLAATLRAQGEDREKVIQRFVSDLERDQGTGSISLQAVAFVGVARVQPIGHPQRSVM